MCVYKTDLELATPWLIILLGTGTACTVLNLLILIAISLVGVSGTVSHCLARVISMISNRFDLTMLSNIKLIVFVTVKNRISIKNL